MGALADATRAVLASLAPSLATIGVLMFIKSAGSLLSRITGFTHGQLKRGGSGAAKYIGGELAPHLRSRQLKIARRGGALGWFAGKSVRRANVKQSQEQQVDKAQSEYLKDYTLAHPDYAKKAAGISGASGVTSIQAAAVVGSENTEDEKLSNAVTLLSKTLKDLGGVDGDELSVALEKYLKNPKEVGNQTIKGDDGKVFDLTSLSSNPDLMKAALHIAAGAGGVLTIRQARMSKDLDQNMVDDVILKNRVTLKEKGGYDLATNRNLAYGRTDDTFGSELTDAIRDNKMDKATEIMQRSTLSALATSSARDFSVMKGGVIQDIAKSLQAGVTPRGIDDKKTAELMGGLKQVLSDATTVPQIQVRLSQHLTAVQAGKDALFPPTTTTTAPPNTTNDQNDRRGYL
jgi:hypothetical protein